LLLCDGGGSNPSNSWLFKQDLQQLANQTGLEIRVAHFAPYCSKHNPIEHRVFPHVTRACEGMILKSVDIVKSLMERTATFFLFTASSIELITDSVVCMTSRQAANWSQ